MTDLLNPNETNTLPTNNLPPLPSLPTQPIVPPQAYSGNPTTNSNIPKKNIKPFIIIGIILLLLIIGCLIFNSLVGNKKNSKSTSTTKNSTTPTTKNSAVPTTAVQKETVKQSHYSVLCDYNGVSLATIISIDLDKIDDDYYHVEYRESVDKKANSNFSTREGIDILKKNSNGDFVGLYNKDFQFVFNIIDEKSVTVKNSIKSDEIIDSCFREKKYIVEFKNSFEYTDSDKFEPFFKEGSYISDDNTSKLEIYQKSHLGFFVTLTDIQSTKTCSAYLSQHKNIAGSVVVQFISLSQKSDSDNIDVSTYLKYKDYCDIDLNSQFFKPSN